MSKLGCITGLLLVAVSVGFAIAGYPLSLVVTAGTLLWFFWRLDQETKESLRQSQAEQARRLAIAPPVGDCWRRQFEADGLAHLIPETEKKVRMALRIETIPFDGKLGGSRLGGVPDLPAEAEWAGRFIAQINLADVAEVFPDSFLPKAGYLWFFLERGVDGRAYYAPAETPLSPAESVPSTRGIRFVLFQDIPDNPEAPDAYSDIRDYLGDHKMFGYGNWVQSESEAGASKQLLLQLACDDEVDFYWGDGQIYFLIDDEDLKRGRFERTTSEIQCT